MTEIKKKKNRISNDRRSKHMHELGLMQENGWL